MKKIKFLSGIGTIYAFAVIALTGFLFTSCEKEDIKATFEPGPAEITFNVKVVDAMDGDVTSTATITGADKISKNASIPAGTVNITAAYKGVTATQAVAYDALTIGGKRTVNVTILISSEYTITQVTSVPVPTVYTLGDATHSHNGENWALNDHDYILTRDISYKIFNNQTAVSTVTKVDLSAFVAALNYGDKSTTGTLSVQVSAWAYYRDWLLLLLFLILLLLLSTKRLPLTLTTSLDMDMEPNPMQAAVSRMQIDVFGNYNNRKLKNKRNESKILNLIHFAGRLYCCSKCTRDKRQILYGESY